MSYLCAAGEPPRLGPAPSTAADRAPAPPPAWVYLVRCEDGSLYAGWTTDLARRLQRHRGGRGARYTRMRGAVQLAYARRCADKSDALRQEAALKRMTKADKEALAARWAADHALTVRLAEDRDLPAVTELYNWYVRHSTATFQYTPATRAEMAASMEAALAVGPFLVAENAAGALCGYACAHPFHPREAYAWCAETTIYCDPDCVGQGVGRRLYAPLLELLRRQGYRAAAALVAHPNPGSEAFHKAMGFHSVGTQPRCGYKFGRWLDLQTWWLDLCPGLEEPAPVRRQLPRDQVEAVLAAAAAPAAR